MQAKSTKQCRQKVQTQAENNKHMKKIQDLLVYS